MNKRRHFGWIDLVHLGAHQDSTGGYTLVIGLIENKTLLADFVDVLNGHIESILGKRKLFSKFENPNNCKFLIFNLIRINGRTRTGGVERGGRAGSFGEDKS